MSRLYGFGEPKRSPLALPPVYSYFGLSLGSSTVVPIAAPLAVHCLPFGHPDILGQVAQQFRFGTRVLAGSKVLVGYSLG